MATMTSEDTFRFSEKHTFVYRGKCLLNSFRKGSLCRNPIRGDPRIRICSRKKHFHLELEFRRIKGAKIKKIKIKFDFGNYQISGRDKFHGHDFSTIIDYLPHCDQRFTLQVSLKIQIKVGESQPKLCPKVIASLKALTITSKTINSPNYQVINETGLIQQLGETIHRLGSAKSIDAIKLPDNVPSPPFPFDNLIRIGGEIIPFNPHFQKIGITFSPHFTSIAKTRFYIDILGAVGAVDASDSNNPIVIQINSYERLAANSIGVNEAGSFTLHVTYPGLNYEQGIPRDRTNIADAQYLEFVLEIYSDEGSSYTPLPDGNDYAITHF